MAEERLVGIVRSYSNMSLATLLHSIHRCHIYDASIALKRSHDYSAGCAEAFRETKSGLPPIFSENNSKTLALLYIGHDPPCLNCSFNIHPRIEAWGKRCPATNLFGRNAQDAKEQAAK